MSALWIAFTFKATLWAGALCVAARLVPIQHPQARRVLALVGLWGIWLVPWLLLPVGGAAMQTIPISNTIGTSSFPWLLVTLWICGSVVLLTRLLCEAAGIARLVRTAQNDPFYTSTALEVRLSPEIDGPCMTGWWRPCVLLPLEASTWPEPTLQAALRHEAQHARQHDGLHRFCAQVLRALFWWNPAVHVLCGIYEEESEVCCDLEATSTGVSRLEYGEMLLAHATGSLPRCLAISFARRSGLRDRISRLLVVPRHSAWMTPTRWIAALLLVAAAGVLVVAVRIAPLELPPHSTMESEAMLRLSANPFPGAP